MSQTNTTLKASAWMPDRKIIAGGIVGIGGFFIMKETGMPAEDAAAYSGVIALVAQYFIPKSYWDKIKGLDDTIKSAIKADKI